MAEQLKSMTPLRSFIAVKKLIKHKTRIQELSRHKNLSIYGRDDLDEVIDMLNEAVLLGLRPKKRKR